MENDKINIITTKGMKSHDEKVAGKVDLIMLLLKKKLLGK